MNASRSKATTVLLLLVQCWFCSATEAFAQTAQQPVTAEAALAGVTTPRLSPAATSAAPAPIAVMRRPRRREMALLIRSPCLMVTAD